MAVRGGVQLGEASGSSMWLLFFSREASSEALPWRCGAGFSSENLRAPRCPPIFFLEKRARRPFRGCAGRGSARSSFGVSSMSPFFFFGVLAGRGGTIQGRSLRSPAVRTPRPIPKVPPPGPEGAVGAPRGRPPRGSADRPRTHQNPHKAGGGY